MAKNVFISFRYNDGNLYKDSLSKLFNACDDTIDYSEDVDRSRMTEERIRQYLYSKLRKSSITIILLTPMAVNHKKDYWGVYDDWMYDEIRYSLEDRGGNRSNGIIAVYTPEAKDMLISTESLGTVCVRNVDNLFRKNMMNVNPKYKKNPNQGVFDRDYDSYCSLIPWDDFVQNVEKYIKIATQKRDEIYKYDVVKRL